MKNSILYLLMFLLSMYSINFYGQHKKTISGTVKDISGEALPGVSVILKGSNIGTVSDLHGKYSITISGKNAVLSYSFIGFVTQEISIGNRTTLDVVLSEDTQQLDEIVVVGYGTMAKKDLTGSVSSVSGGQLKDLPVTSAAQAIVGRMPGVQITQTEGSPDAEFKVRIRGGGSITQDNSPLYIVDGFPVDNINDVAPTDIASINVLKDASSTAIYGARGANGVIIVTTKAASEGKAKINYNMYVGWKNITKKLDVLDPYEYALYTYEQLGSDTYTPKFGNFQDMDLYKEVDGSNWQEQIFGRTGTSIYNNVAISGGSKVARYNISLTRNDEKAIMIGSGFSRTNLNIKTSYDAKPWLKLELNSRLSDYNLKGGGTTSTTGKEADSRLAHIIGYFPVRGISEFGDSEDLDDEDDDLASSYLFNPLQQTNDDYRRLNQLMFNVNGAVEIKFSSRLKYRLEFGSQFTNSTSKRFYGIHTSNANQNGAQPIAQIIEKHIRSYRLANILTYDLSNFFAKKDKLTIMLGEELSIYQSKSLTSSAKYFPKYIDAESALGMMNLGTADPIVSALNPDNNLSSFFGRLNYSYKGRYLLTATFRADGSSKFARGNRWGYFPSSAVAWRISEEEFMKSTENYLSNLKLRLSYGKSGNNRIQDNAWKKTFSISSGLISLGEEGTPTSVIVPESILSNPKLKWETTISRNVGIDFGFFKQRLSGSIELYKNTTKDLLIRASIPRNTGYTTQFQNIGQTSNKGLEITLEGVIIDSKDFTLSASFNIGFNKNRIDKLGSAAWKESPRWTLTNGPTEEYIVKEGESLGIMYGYQTEGMYKIEDFNYNPTDKTYTLKPGIADNSSLINDRRFGPGSLKLVNQNPEEDNVVDDKDRIIIGNANPKHTGGFSFTAQFKGFDFSAFFNWVYGNDVYNANKLAFTAQKDFKNILDVMNSKKRWMTVDPVTGVRITDPTELAALNANATMWSGGQRAIPFHSWAVEDGSFLRLNNLTIGYSVPNNKVLTRLGITQLRIYATGYNLWLWTNYTGYDPEVDTKRTTPLTPSVDWCAYPRSRSYNIGLNVTF